MTCHAYVFLGLFLYCLSYLVLDDFLFASSRKTIADNTMTFLVYLPIILLSNHVWYAGKRISLKKANDLNVIDINQRRIMRKYK